MGIFHTLLRNLVNPARTQPPQGLPPPPRRYRGALTHDAARCTACGTCAWVCAPKAIRFREHGDGTVSWQFYIGQCAFCGLCEQSCPTRAIGNTAALPATALNADGDGLRLESRIARVPCTRCGQLHMPLPAELQRRLLAGSPGPAAEAELGYCPDCRGYASRLRLRQAYGSPTRPADAAPGASA